MASIILTVIYIGISCLMEGSAENGSGEFKEILSLIQKQELVAARMIAEKVVEDEPDNVDVKYLLAFIHATAEGGDLPKVLELQTKVHTKVREDITITEKAPSWGLLRDYDPLEGPFSRFTWHFG